MHGLYTDKQQEFITLPDNVFVIFASKPGYKLNPNFLTGDSKYNRIKNSNEEFKKFLRGEAPGPRQFQRWRSHIYRPRDTVRNITFFGPHATNVPWMRSGLGMGYVGSKIITPAQVDLEKIINIVKAQKYTTVIFVASCRSVEGHAQSIPRGAGENQNYRLRSSKRARVEYALRMERRRRSSSNVTMANSNSGNRRRN